MDLGLEGKVALVTGGGRDVGREISITLAREGAAVAVNYLHAAAGAEETVAEIRKAYGRAAVFQGDVSDYAQVTELFARVARELGPVDILINNAGFVRPNFFLRTKPEDWKRQIDVGLFGVLNCCHVGAQGMVERGFGRIINFAGDSARVGERRLSVTAASRGGVLALTKTLALELGESNITVNALALGVLPTAHFPQGFIETNYDRIVQQYSLKRLGEPRDVAPMVAFLASACASWITGQIISISGGYSTVG